MSAEAHQCSESSRLEATLVPIKAFHSAKLRLAGELTADERKALAQRMALQVIRAAKDLLVLVVCDDLEVAEWARSQGAEVVLAPGLGLNGAVEHGVEALAKRGVKQVIVAHADLPLAKDLRMLLNHPTYTVTLVPDRLRDGTNVAVIPTDSGFHFNYGPGSFRSHCNEAKRLGLSFQVLEPEELTFDVDLPSDLAQLPREWKDALLSIGKWSPKTSQE